MNRNILFLILGVILVGAVVLMNSDLDLKKPEVVADIKPAVIYDMGGKFDGISNLETPNTFSVISLLTLREENWL